MAEQSPLPLSFRSVLKLMGKIRLSSILRPAGRAPEDWRSPKPGGLPNGPGEREASWSVHPPQYCYGGRAVVLYRQSATALWLRLLERLTKPKRCRSRCGGIATAVQIQPDRSTVRGKEPPSNLIPGSFVLEWIALGRRMAGP